MHLKPLNSATLHYVVDNIYCVICDARLVCARPKIRTALPHAPRDRGVIQHIIGCVDALYTGCDVGHFCDSSDQGNKEETPR